jgi:bifunctional non-homologous end joining protein LigD
MKMRINRGQEFVIGGYTIGGPRLRAHLHMKVRLIGAARRERLHAGVTRGACENQVGGGDPSVRESAREDRWPLGQGLIKEKMAARRWLKPSWSASSNFRWSGETLRHSKFVGMRDDKPARAVVRESGRPENDADA